MNNNTSAPYGAPDPLQDYWNTLQYQVPSSQPIGIGNNLAQGRNGYAQVYRLPAYNGSGNVQPNMGGYNMQPMGNFWPGQAQNGSHGNSNAYPAPTTFPFQPAGNYGQPPAMNTPTTAIPYINVIVQPGPAPVVNITIMDGSRRSSGSTRSSRDHGAARTVRSRTAPVRSTGNDGGAGNRAASFGRNAPPRHPPTARNAAVPSSASGGCGGDFVCDDCIHAAAPTGTARRGHAPFGASGRDALSSRYYGNAGAVNRPSMFRQNAPPPYPAAVPSRASGGNVIPRVRRIRQRFVRGGTVRRGHAPIRASGRDPLSSGNGAVGAGSDTAGVRRLAPPPYSAIVPNADSSATTSSDGNLILADLLDRCVQETREVREAAAVADGDASVATSNTAPVSAATAIAVASSGDAPLGTNGTVGAATHASPAKENGTARHTDALGNVIASGGDDARNGSASAAAHTGAARSGRPDGFIRDTAGNPNAVANALSYLFSDTPFSGNGGDGTGSRIAPPPYSAIVPNADSSATTSSDRNPSLADLLDRCVRDVREVREADAVADGDTCVATSNTAPVSGASAIAVASSGDAPLGTNGTVGASADASLNVDVPSTAITFDNAISSVGDILNGREREHSGVVADGDSPVAGPAPGGVSFGVVSNDRVPVSSVAAVSDDSDESSNDPPPKKISKRCDDGQTARRSCDGDGNSTGDLRRKSKSEEDWAIDTLSDWLKERHFDSDSTRLSVKEMGRALTHFYRTVQNLGSAPKSAVVLKGVRAALGSHLKLVHPAKIDIIRGKEFHHANLAFGERVEQLLGRDTRFLPLVSSTIEVDDLILLKRCTFEINDPEQLFFKVFVNLVTFFGKHTATPLTDWAVNSIVFMFDEGIERAYVSWSSPNKNGTETRMYETKTMSCPVKALRRYISMTTATTPKLFQRMIGGASQDAAAWYGPEALTNGELEAIMPTISDHALLSRKYTTTALLNSVYDEQSNRLHLPMQSVIPGAECRKM